MSSNLKYGGSQQICGGKRTNFGSARYRRKIVTTHLEPYNVYVIICFYHGELDEYLEVLCVMISENLLQHALHAIQDKCNFFASPKGIIAFCKLSRSSPW